MNQILVTDSLFISADNEQQLIDAGFEVVRLDKPEANEDELCEAIKGKVGYILGGVEKVTDKIIDAADSLKAIVFTGIDHKHFIPGWKRAEEKGILMGSTPDGPTQAVAEWAVTSALAMNRGMFELAIPDGKMFLTTPGLAEQNIGIIGLGRIGTRIAEMLQPFKPAAIHYYSTHSHPDKEQNLSLQYTDMDDVIAQSDIIFLCVPGSEVGKNFFTAKHIASMRHNALIVSFIDTSVFDLDALYTALMEGKVRWVSDYFFGERFSVFPKSTCYSFRGSNAFNTKAAIKLTSDTATQTLIDLLNKK